MCIRDRDKGSADIWEDICEIGSADDITDDWLDEGTIEDICEDDIELIIGCDVTVSLDGVAFVIDQYLNVNITAIIKSNKIKTIAIDKAIPFGDLKKCISNFNIIHP